MFLVIQEFSKNEEKSLLTPHSPLKCRRAMTSLNFGVCGGVRSYATHSQARHSQPGRSSPMQLFFPYTAGSIISRWQYQFFTENSEFPKFRHFRRPQPPPGESPPLAPKSYLYDLSYALLVVNLKNNIFCLDYL